MRKQTYETTALCPRCHKPLRTTDITGYDYVCQNCDENFYSIELSQKPVSISFDGESGRHTVEFDIPPGEEEIEEAKKKISDRFLVTLEGIRNAGEILVSYGLTGDYSTYQCIADPDRDDLLAALEDTLHRILEAGGDEDDVRRIMGAVLPSKEEEQYSEEEISIDLGYVLPGLLIFFKREIAPEKTTMSA